MNIKRYNTTPKVKQLTGTRKKTFMLSIANTYSATTGWSGGSRDYYTLLNFKTKVEEPLQGVGNHFNQPTTSQPIPPDCILITTGTFNSKPATPYINCLPEQEVEVLVWLGVPVNTNPYV